MLLNTPYWNIYLTNKIKQLDEFDLCLRRSPCRTLANILSTFDDQTHILNPMA